MVSSNNKKTSDAKNSRKKTSLRPRVVEVSRNENYLLAKLSMQLASMVFISYSPQYFSPEKDVVYEMYKKYCGVSDDSHLEVNTVKKLTQMLNDLPVNKMNSEDLLVLDESLNSLKQKVIKKSEENIARVTNTLASSFNK
ncbi:hypothetical protein TanjilG_18993 [Lupinus angustifolius]|uniref:Uncharacterized protein n=1 Tax=Lupinus angustifolius TaxID=3871 RepID=A0A4P1RQU1_LUPAN|nr:hypothetical protein TanjilG_18993 [Lupinus angustifolius]